MDNNPQDSILGHVLFLLNIELILGYASKIQQSANVRLRWTNMFHQHGKVGIYDH